MCANCIPVSTGRERRLGGSSTNSSLSMVALYCLHQTQSSKTTLFEDFQFSANIRSSCLIYGSIICDNPNEGITRRGLLKWIRQRAIPGTRPWGEFSLRTQDKRVKKKKETEAQSRFYPLPLPLRFCPHARTDEGVGWRVRARWPLKRRLSWVTLQTKGYDIFPRIPSKSLATATQCKYFFVVHWVALVQRHPNGRSFSSQNINILVAVLLTVAI